MKNFLVVYLSSESAAEIAKWKNLDGETRKQKEKAGMSAWMSWAEKNSRAIVDNGTPLGKTKKVGPDGISDTKNRITAYTIVRAESHEEAAKIFRNHPHFSVFPGDSIEVMECLPLPTM